MTDLVFVEEPQFDCHVVAQLLKLDLVRLELACRLIELGCALAVARCIALV